MAEPCTIGIDFGTNSVRALIVRTDDGHELAEAVSPYRSGAAGILLDPLRPNLARQNPGDYIESLEACVRQAILEAGLEFNAGDVVGIGVDTTGSTPLPIDATCRPLALDPAFADDLDAHVWLWKDHTAYQEAADITATAERMRPEYLKKCGGTYSSEWYWAKIWHCLKTAPHVFEAAHTWVEHADWIPALLCGVTTPDGIRRGVCAAGHKALYHDSWGGYPDEDFLAALDPGLARLRRTLPEAALPVSKPAGRLAQDWAARLGLEPGISVAVGAFDAHLGGVGSGVRTGTLVKIMGTSTCDIMTSPMDADLPDIPGLCGIVPESVLPGHYGLEAGQSGVGDIFNWFVETVRPDRLNHDALTAEAERLTPGESGLLALDWHNGNRTVLVDQRLTGTILGLTLHSTPAAIYRALIEATAFGARVIVDRLEAYGVLIDRVVVCGGISAKNRLIMQIYADVLERPMLIARSKQTCALGAAIAGSVVAGAHIDFPNAIEAMTGILDEQFTPRDDAVPVYRELYELYRRLHDAFGVSGTRDDLADVMKCLLALRDARVAHA